MKHWTVKTRTHNFIELSVYVKHDDEIIYIERNMYNRWLFTQKKMETGTR